MPVTITIRSIPDDVRDKLALRAKSQGKSLQEYLKGELERLAQTPSVAEWLAKVRAAQAQFPKLDLTGDEIVELIHEDREERDATLIERIEGKWK